MGRDFLDCLRMKAEIVTVLSIYSILLFYFPHSMFSRILILMSPETLFNFTLCWLHYDGATAMLLNISFEFRLQLPMGSMQFARATGGCFVVCSAVTGCACQLCSTDGGVFICIFYYLSILFVWGQFMIYHLCFGLVNGDLFYSSLFCS